MMTTGGIHKEVILGNPAYHKDHNAKFVVMIPHGTYAIFESLSEEEATFHSYVAIPGKEDNAELLYHTSYPHDTQKFE